MRDKPPYEPEAEAYGTEALGRASLYGPEAEALTGRASLRDEPLARRHSHANSNLATICLHGILSALFLRHLAWTSLLTNESSLRAFNAYGTGRGRLRDKPPYEPEAEAYGTEALGRASLRAGGGGAYGTSLFTGRASCAEALMDEPPYERIFFTGRRRLRDASSLNAYGTGRRPLRDKPPYEAEAEAYGRRLAGPGPGPGSGPGPGPGALARAGPGLALGLALALALVLVLALGVAVGRLAHSCVGLQKSGAVRGQDKGSPDNPSRLEAASKWTRVRRTTQGFAGQPFTT